MDDDLEAYIAGLNTTLYDRYDEERFRWKFVENPFNLGFVSIVVVEEEATGEPVGFNGFLPLEVRGGDDRFTVVQGCDGFVDRGHRRRGLFQRTIEFMSRELARRGPELLMGFNFSGSTAAARRVGAVHVCDIHRWRLQPGKLEDGSRRPEEVELAPCSVEEVHEAYERWADGTSRLHVHRSLDYLRWRFERSPLREHALELIEAEGSIRGYIVWNLTEDDGRTELQIDDYVLLGSVDLLSGAILELVRRDADLTLLEVRGPMDDALDGVLRGLGFEREPEPLYSLIMRGIHGVERVGDELIRGGVTISQPERWHLTSSDMF
ncbi:MAG: hypothetical protein ACE5OO_03455 [Candidatus Bathyarchaeia archaeon]